MLALRIEIARWLSDNQPGFVECRFTDAHGVEHLVHEKVPVVTLDKITAASVLPLDGVIGCERVDTRLEGGRRIVRVSTERPWHVASTAGLAHSMYTPSSW